MSRIRVRTASRLHFGLLGWGPRAVRQFGGVGLMIDQPGVEVIGSESPDWEFIGPLSDRVREIARAVQMIPDDPDTPTLMLVPGRIEVVKSPPEHVGLGVGTQLSLAVVHVLLQLASGTAHTADDLARYSGRGRRSGIGLHGFLHGGLLVDGGRRDDLGPPPLIARVAFPAEWSVLLVQPPAPVGRHGPDELQAFSNLPPLADPITDRLCRLVLLGVLPAIMERDLFAFGSALSEIQRHVGEAFAPVQGGPFASPWSESIVAELGRLGLAGAGQTSWGPTLYAFGFTSEIDQAEITGQLCRRFGLDPRSLVWTRAFNQGANVSIIP